MRLAAVQLEPALCDLEETLSRLDGLLPRAAGCELVVLPELCNSGYAFGSREAARQASEELPSGPFVAHLSAWCARTGARVVSGLNERAGDRLYNSSVLVGPDGVEGVYRKLHLFDREKLWFTPGDLGLPLFAVGEVRVGMLVCFDWRFPEAWRRLALDGADVIAHPSNLVIPRDCQRAVPVHALVNHVFVATANRIGREADLAFTGRSIVAGPGGVVLSDAPPDRPDVLVVEIDPARARDKRVTGRNDAFADRRTDVYGP